MRVLFRGQVYEAELAALAARRGFAFTVAADTDGVVRGLPQADALWITWGADFEHLAPARFIAAHVPESSIALRTSHLGTQIAAAEAGVGVLLADRHLTRVKKLAEVSLSPEVFALLPARPGELWIVGHRALRDVPRIAATWEFLLAEASRVGAAQD